MTDLMKTPMRALRKALMLLPLLMSTGCIFHVEPGPTDEEMISNFYTHERSFEQLLDILSGLPCSRHFTYYSVDADTFSFHDFPDTLQWDSNVLSAKDKALIDSLLNDIGCKRFRCYPNTSGNEAEPDGHGICLILHYFSRGLSVSGLGKDYVFEPNWKGRIPLTDPSMELYGVIGSSLDTIVWKAIKGDWYIELSKT